MSRRAIALWIILFVSAALGFGLFAAERRADRASNTLRRELLDLGPVPSPRPLHVTETLDAGTDVLLAGLFTGTPNVDALLRATHARQGGLPDGLSVGTAGPDSWSAVPGVAKALGARLESTDASPEMCLDALAVGRDLARGGGTKGLTAAATITEAVFTRCAQLLNSQAHVDALNQLIDGAPSMVRAFREADLDLQVHVFGRWMRPQDLAELPPAIQRAAHDAEQLPTAFLERQRLLGMWTKMSKTTHEAMDNLDLPPKEREALFEQLEARIDTPSVNVITGWRAAIATHEHRLALLRMLHLATRLSMKQRQTQQWPTLSEVEAGDFAFTASPDAATLTLRGTKTSLTLPWRPAP